MYTDCSFKSWKLSCKSATKKHLKKLKKNNALNLLLCFFDFYSSRLFDFQISNVLLLDMHSAHRISNSIFLYIFDWLNFLLFLLFFSLFNCLLKILLVLKKLSLKLQIEPNFKLWSHPLFYFEKSKLKLILFNLIKSHSQIKISLDV